MKIGILGSGQLGKMLIEAGRRIGLSPTDFRTFVSFEDKTALLSFAQGLDAATYELENFPLECASILAQMTPCFFPAPSALEIAQDRLFQKEHLKRLGIPTAPFEAVEELKAALQKTGYPALLKSRRMGYDGKGQFLFKDESQLRDFSPPSVPTLLEGFIPFQRELSIIAARAKSGDSVFYPLVENRHRQGILRTTLAPAPGLSPALQNEAEKIARMILESLNYAGVLCVEFFQVGDKLIVNEFATRVHNSGHWTIEGAETSQFENHLRAGLGLPLGSGRALGPTAMINLISRLPDTKSIKEIETRPDTFLHLYGKSPAPNRKLGHLTLRAATEQELQRRVAALSAIGYEIA